MVPFCMALLCASCASTPTTRELDPLHTLVENYFEEMLKLDPLFATSIGDHRFDDQLTIPISEEIRKKERALIDESLQKVRDLQCTDESRAERDPQSSLTCQTFIADLEALQTLDDTDLSHLMPFNQFSSFFSDFADIASGSSFITFNTQKDYENFMARMKRVPAYIDVMIANMREGMKKKITTPRILVDRAIKQLQDLLVEPIKESVFYKPLLKKTYVSPAIRAEYEQTIQSQIYPAYKKLLEFAQKEYRPVSRTTTGLLALRGGRRNYEALVRYHTTLKKSPDEIMLLGLKEVERISSEFEKVKAQMKFQGTLPEFFKALRNDPKLYPFKSSAEVLAAYQKINSQIWKRIPEHFRLLPKAPFEIREVEKFRAESASEAYENASPDGSRPGVFWVPIPQTEKYNSKSMESLFLHEAIPGHHFQISIQQELTDLPRYRRFEGNTAYVEGWALYTESLGRDLGLYTDPYQWIGRLEAEMHRAIRLVVDVGMHWKGWSRERAIEYSLLHEPGDEPGIRSEIERYMVIPGQALSYKMGEQKILELKQLAQSRLGARYDDRDFHDQILKDGALPLSVLERKIKHWLDQKEHAH